MKFIKQFFILILAILILNSYAQARHFHAPKVKTPNFNHNFNHHFNHNFNHHFNHNFNNDFNYNANLEAGGAALGGITSSFSKAILMSSNGYNPRYKIVAKAQPDAATYIISNGEIKGAYLEQAFMLLRKEYPNASNMELAEAIMATPQ